MFNQKFKDEIAELKREGHYNAIVASRLRDAQKDIQKRLYDIKADRPTPIKIPLRSEKETLEWVQVLIDDCFWQSGGY